MSRMCLFFVVTGEERQPREDGEGILDLVAGAEGDVEGGRSEKRSAAAHEVRFQNIQMCDVRAIMVFGHLRSSCKKTKLGPNSVLFESFSAPEICFFARAPQMSF